MATSGSYNYSVSALTVIQKSLEDLQVVQEGESPTAAQLAKALVSLNMLVKQHQGLEFGAPGQKVHSRQRVNLFMAVGQQTYLIGPGSSDARAAVAIGRTTIDVAEASGQTTLSVAETTDTTTDPTSSKAMATSDIIGVELDDGTIHWSTISSISAGDTVTIADATSDTAAVGNYVWWFTARAQRFPHIESAVIRDENRNDVPLTIYRTQAEYDEGVPSKYQDGRPTCILVEPLLTQTRVTLDAQPTDITDTIVLTVLYPAEDYDASEGSDTLAFPQEAYRFFSWELAFDLSAWAGHWTQQMEMNRQEARSLYLNLNPEVSNAYYQPGGL